MIADRFFNSIAFRIPLAIGFICALVLLLSLMAVKSLTDAKTQMTSYGVQTYADLAVASNISRQASALLSSAPFILNTTSPYRLSDESLSIAEQIDSLNGYIARNGGSSGSTDTPGTAELVDALGSVRATTLKLAAAAEEAQLYKDRITRSLEAIRHGTGPEPDLQLKQFALNAASADSLFSLGEIRRSYLRRSAVALTPASAGQRSVQYSIYEQIFQMREIYLRRFIEMRSILSEMRNASQKLTSGLEQQSQLLRNDFNTGVAAISNNLDSMRTFVLATVLLVIILCTVTIYYSIIRVSAGIAQISDALNRLARGERDVRLPAVGTNETELQDLIRAFNAFKNSVERFNHLHIRATRAARTIRWTFRSMNEGIALFDANGKAMAMNRRIVEFAGVGAAARTWSLPQLASAFTISSAGPVPDGVPSVTRISKNNRILEVSRTDQPGDRSIVVVRDITEQENQEQEVQRAKKLDGLVRLSHQLSHELGNMIGIVVGSVGMLEKMGTLTDPQKRNVARIRKASERGKELVEGMLSFASKQHNIPVRCDLRKTLRGVEDVLHVILGPRISLTIDAPANLPDVSLDPALFEQAIVNICRNSAAAMPDGGDIIIALEHTADRVRVVVTDTGKGIPPELIDRVFEPYFTTRRSSGGTGLGLAIVYGFVRQANGDITLTSTVNVGTTITMSFLETA
ncbi:sensor histidine kinase [Phyllobacterium myrsinacearum]|uniref:histidine kinase n=1 Tax=Phyllobacterium myrsinacearum TaxID=28101 RepID=A0A2S9JQA9_9HYPH|nr:ATP-binding protein [Phyllobacterium myrsinacearum]PRD55407.1 two-component sensor histidine kinase [Phyllobacterium myrsinacearum]PWV91744.1 signal transduction histidine kinase [Phyllobacterium myrsinacearum]RZV05814.1 signal transduction histidine kinase [Phyllobacterium myrsinacearum]